MTSLLSTSRFIAAACAVFMWTTASRAEDVINVRLSYKVIVNPATGLPPAGVTEADIDTAIAGANDLLKTYQRGYRLVRAGPLTPIGTAGGFNRPDPGYYFGVDFDKNRDEMDNLDADAHNRPGMYAWNSNAINIFIVPGLGDGVCSNPTTSGREIIIVAVTHDADPFVVLHESSHFFAECHTQGCQCGACPGGGGVCDTIPGDDRISDTLPDLQCWDRNDISANAFNGLQYDELDPARQERVNDVFFNLMSYHRDQPQSHTRQTEEQLDLFADFASVIHTTVRDGYTWFVDHAASGSEDGRSGHPFNRVAEGVVSAGPNDIVLIRPGTYPENLTIRDPMTLRVPRGGVARIGAP